MLQTHLLVCGLVSYRQCIVSAPGGGFAPRTCRPPAQPNALPHYTAGAFIRVYRDPIRGSPRTQRSSVALHVALARQRVPDRSVSVCRMAHSWPVHAARWPDVTVVTRTRSPSARKLRSIGASMDRVRPRQIAPGTRVLSKDSPTGAHL